MVVSRLNGYQTKATGKKE